MFKIHGYLIVSVTRLYISEIIVTKLNFRTKTGWIVLMIRFMSIMQCRKHMEYQLYVFANTLKKYVHYPSFFFGTSFPKCAPLYENYWQWRCCRMSLFLKLSYEFRKKEPWWAKQGINIWFNQIALIILQTLLWISTLCGPDMSWYNMKWCTASVKLGHFELLL